MTKPILGMFLAATRHVFHFVLMQYILRLPRQYMYAVQQPAEQSFCDICYLRRPPGTSDINDLFQWQCMRSDLPVFITRERQCSMLFPGDGTVTTAMPPNSQFPPTGGSSCLSRLRPGFYSVHRFVGICRASPWKCLAGELSSSPLVIEVWMGFIS